MLESNEGRRESEIPPSRPQKKERPTGLLRLQLQTMSRNVKQILDEGRQNNGPDRNETA